MSLTFKTLNLLLSATEIGESLGWLTVFLAVLVICLYLLHLLHGKRQAAETARWRDQFSELEQLRQSEVKERTIVDFENRLLRLAAASADLDHLGTAFLEQLTHNHNGFAVLLECRGTEFRFRHSVHLSPQSQQRFWVEPELIRRAAAASPLRLSRDEVVHSRWWQLLNGPEQRASDEAWVIHWGESAGRRLLWITTALFPDDSERTLQAVQHWAAMIGQQWLKTERWVSQQQQLELTREMLELRSVTELNFPAPGDLLQELLQRLSQMAHFDRAALYFANAQRPTAISRERVLITPNWEQKEAALVHEQHDLRESLVISDEYGLDKTCPFATALIVPLGHEIVRLGTVCLTRVSSDPVTEPQRELVEWGAGHVLESIVRAIDRAGMSRRARRDGLTQLANRQTFDLEFVRMLDLCRRSGDELALILFDLDHFKQVNDTHGHQMGDKVLRIAATAIEEAVSQARATDAPLPARYGGEEFAVLLPGVGLAGARRIAESVRESVAERLKCGLPDTNGDAAIPNGLEVTISGGIAVFPEHGFTVEALIAAADAALYQSKSSGRNRVTAAS